jgi:hypothetical protein
MAKHGPEMWKPSDWGKKRRDAVDKYQSFVHGYAEDWNTAIDHGAEAMAGTLVPLLEKILSAYFDNTIDLAIAVRNAKTILEGGSRRIE